jgi:hypothetical protein
MIFSCSRLEVENNAEDAEDVKDIYLNYFDSSVRCSEDIFVSSDFEAFLLFIVVWLILAPSYLLLRLKREFIIETYGMGAKFILLLTIKYISRLN